MEQHHIGELDQRIQLQSVTKVRDGGGGFTETWATYATVWAKIRTMTGREREAAQRIEAHANYLLVIRYRSDVKTTHRIQWRGRVFNIRFPKTAGPRTSWLEMECELGATT